MIFPTLGADPSFSFEPTDTTHLENVLDLPALILHTTGTTGNPKAIMWSQCQLAQGAAVPAVGEVSLVGKIIGVHAVPMFVAMGSINLFAAPTLGMIMAFFAPRPPPALSTNPVNVLESALASKCNFVISVPVFLEVWAKDSAIVDKLVSMDGFVSRLMISKEY